MLSKALFSHLGSELPPHVCPQAAKHLTVSCRCISDEAASHWTFARIEAYRVAPLKLTQSLSLSSKQMARRESFSNDSMLRQDDSAITWHACFDPLNWVPNLRPAAKEKNSPGSTEAPPGNRWSRSTWISFRFKGVVRRCLALPSLVARKRFAASTAIRHGQVSQFMPVFRA